MSEKREQKIPKGELMAVALSKSLDAPAEKVSECCKAKVSRDTAFHAKGWICTFCGNPCSLQEQKGE